MACKCSDCPEVGCRLNRLNMAAQENMDSAQHNHQHAQPAIYRLAQAYLQEYGISRHEWEVIQHFARWAYKQQAGAL